MSSAARRRKVKKKNPIAVIGAVVITALIFIGLAVVAAIGPKIRAEEKIYAVMTSTPPVKVAKPPTQPKVKAEKKAAPHAKAESKTKANGHPNNAPHIATATGSGNGAGSGFTAQGGGNGKAGVLPGSGTVTPKPAAAPPPSTPAPKPTPAPPKPAPTPPPPKPAPTPVPVVTSIVSADAQPEDQVKPVIPDSLRAKAMNASVRAMVTIEADGTFTVTLRNSSGDADLDKIALDTLRRWRWKPAMRNGKAVKSFRLVRFDFVVQ